MTINPRDVARLLVDAVGRHMAERLVREACGGDSAQPEPEPEPTQDDRARARETLARKGYFLR